MKNLRISLLFALVGALAIQIIAAQPMRRTPEERVKQLKEQLTLTAKQEKEVLNIFKNADKKREEMFSEMQDGGDRGAMREKMMKLNDEIDAKIEKLLTKDQQKKYEELKKERRQRMEGRGERKG